MFARPLEVVLLAKLDLIMGELNGRFLRDSDSDRPLDYRTLMPDPARNPPTLGAEMDSCSSNSGQKDPETPLSGHHVPPPGCEVIPQTARLGVRCTPEAILWVKGLADHCSLDCTTLIWQALLRQADACGYYERVPQRYRRKSHPNRIPRII